MNDEQAEFWMKVYLATLQDSMVKNFHNESSITNASKFSAFTADLAVQELNQRGRLLSV